MPTYEYRCAKGHVFERFQKMSDEPIRECPDCGAAAERLISSGAGFLFKGEGFYITDYRSKDYKEKASAETPSADQKKTASSETPSADKKKGTSAKSAPSTGSSTPTEGPSSPSKSRDS